MNIMKLEKDYEEFIELLNDHEIRYLIVGAYAVSYYARPRNTGDIDFFVDNSKENITQLLKVLQKFGFGALDLTQEDLSGDDKVLQLGYEPVRIDIMTGISFKDAFSNREQGKLGSQVVNFISLDDLIINKRASSRTQDKADAELLVQYRKDDSK
jgi:predicted nucleotidyltransferase